MKKYASYILILITLVGLFSPVAQISAEGSVVPEETFEETPGVAAAIICKALTGVGKIICQVHQILNSIIPALIALGVLFFVWGVVSYMIGADEEQKKKGKDKIIYGIIGLAVIAGMWGLVNIIVTTFGLEGQTVNISAVTTSLDNANRGGQCPFNSTNPKFQDLMRYVTCTISVSVIPLIFAVATLMFIWGVVQYVINTEDEAKKSKGRQFMIWGIIALAVMVSVWGLVSILSGTFGIDTVFIPEVRSKK
jgi:hypothetical protein